MLRSKIKFGKVQAKFGNKTVDNTPSKVVQEFLDSSPPPVGIGTYAHTYIHEYIHMLMHTCVHARGRTGLKVKKGKMSTMYVSDGYHQVTDEQGT